MVKFGERLLNGLMRTGWESSYIDYAKLKSAIDAIQGDNFKPGSDAFLELLAAEISKVDLFVVDQLGSFDGALARLNDASAADIHELAANLTELRHFVGTNVIAATKIVKKHDKHVPASLQRREAVAMLVRNCKGVNALPSIYSNLESEMKSRGLSTAGKGVTVITIDSDDPEESEGGLRDLPNWLLHGAEADAKDETANGSTLAYDTFYTTYLSDWSLGLDVPLIGAAAEQEADDKWNVNFSSDATPWKDLTNRQRVLMLLGIFLKISFIVFSLYAFVCSLSFLAGGFRLVAGRQAGEVFRNSQIFNNSIAGMLVGVLVTVLVQSSSTSTSIVITMVAAGLFTVKQAISLIMGANIGTSVTSTIVALAQVGQKDEFRRAFAAATVHDMFNFMAVLVLLPLEGATNYLYHVSLAIINATPSLAEGEKPPDLLKKLTKPFTSLVLKVDKKVITKIAAADTPEKLAALEDARLLKWFFNAGPDDMSDGAAGAVVLVCSLTVLCLALMAIVWTLKSLLKGRIAVWLHRSVNGNVPDLKCGSFTLPLGWISGYFAMLTGGLVTICVQSSSITTSALTPLVGIGVITVERLYPTVLGANIGTCVTGVLAALAADPEKLALTLQVAYSHLLFNITGIFIFYVIWPLRALPVAAAKYLGDTTAEYRWFALAYLFMCFIVIPLIFMGLSFGGSAPVIIVATLVIAIAFSIALINTLQRRSPLWLPAKLRTWEFMPLWLRSLEPLDRVICLPLGGLFRACCICTCPCLCKAKVATPTVKVTSKAKLTAKQPADAKKRITSTMPSSSTSAAPTELEVAAARINLNAV